MEEEKFDPCMTQRVEAEERYEKVKCGFPSTGKQETNEYYDAERGLMPQVNLKQNTPWYITRLEDLQKKVRKLKFENGILKRENCLLKAALEERNSDVG